METDSELVAENVVVYQFSSNGGNDVIQGFNKRDLIDIKNGSLRSAAVTLTAFNDTYHNSNGYIHVTALAGDDYIYGGAGNDWIDVNGKNVVAEGGLGHDYIFAADIEGGTLSGGKGNDTLWAYSDDNSSNTNMVIQYAVGDGRDLVIGYQEDYKIQITTGDVTSVSVRNDDTIIKIGGGSIWLKDYTDAVTLVDANGDAIEVPDELRDILDDDFPAENYSAGKFEPTDYNSLAQENNYLAYNSEKDK